jgi:hypothetical protein
VRSVKETAMEHCGWISASHAVGPCRNLKGSAPKGTGPLFYIIHTICRLPPEGLPADILSKAGDPHGLTILFLPSGQKFDNI